MHLKSLFWLGSFSTIFFFLPSLFLKIGELFISSSWRLKIGLTYLSVGLIIVMIARRRLARLKREKILKQPEDLLYLAKRRLAEGEITLKEFREIKQELK